MKLFIATLLKDYQEDIRKLFKDAKIQIFSSAEITGYKNNQVPNLLEEWFAAGEEHFDSVIIFSFTADENAIQGMKMVKEYNEINKNNFPVRAFIVPVEQSIFIK